jgi:hypothetical protein
MSITIEERDRLVNKLTKSYCNECDCLILIDEQELKNDNSIGGVCPLCTYLNKKDI